MLKIMELMFGMEIALGADVREGRFFIEAGRPGVWERGMKLHPTEVRHPPDWFRFAGPFGGQ